MPDGPRLPAEGIARCACRGMLGATECPPSEDQMELDEIIATISKLETEREAIYVD